MRPSALIRLYGEVGTDSPRGAYPATADRNRPEVSLISGLGQMADEGCRSYGIIGPQSADELRDSPPVRFSRIHATEDRLRALIREFSGFTD